MTTFLGLLIYFTRNKGNRLILKFLEKVGFEDSQITPARGDTATGTAFGDTAGCPRFLLFLIRLLFGRLDIWVGDRRERSNDVFLHRVT